FVPGCRHGLRTGRGLSLGASLPGSVAGYLCRLRGAFDRDGDRLLAGRLHLGKMQLQSSVAEVGADLIGLDLLRQRVGELEAALAGVAALKMLLRRLLPGL